MLFVGYGLYVVAIAMDTYEGRYTDLFWLLEIFKTLDHDALVE